MAKKKKAKQTKTSYLMDNSNGRWNEVNRITSIGVKVFKWVAICLIALPLVTEVVVPIVKTQVNIERAKDSER